jgi:rubrerythrin
MKFHALSLCLAAAVMAGPALAGDRHSAKHHDGKMMHSRERSFYRAGTFYPEQYMYLREIVFPDMPAEEEVARKVTTIIEKQNTEIAHLTSMAPAAQQAGWTNIATVYEHMAQDHSRLATWAGDWLRERGYDVPAPAAAQAATFESPDASIDHVLQMHVESFNNNLAMRQNEKSSTVRGLLLWAAASTARHISLLRTLDRDVDFGRKTVSARLESMMNGSLNASEQTAMIDRIMTEETEYFRIHDTTQPTAVAQTQVIEQVVEVEKPVERIVEVEKIVEKPVIVEKIVEKPVYVDRVVEKRVYVDRPVRQTVAGRRQTIRARRPAK